MCPALLLSGFFLLIGCTLQSNQHPLKKVESLAYADTIKVTNTVKLGDSLNLYLRIPREMLVLNDHYLIVTELTPENFIHVFKLPGIKYLYSWGVNGKGPDEFQLPPGDYFVDGENRLSIYDFALGEVRFYEVTDTSLVQAATATSLRYEGQFNYLDKIIRLNDSLYVANYDETPMRVPEFEHIALKPDNDKIISKFGNYPATDLEDDLKYFAYRKNNIAKPNGAGFASFYSYFNRLKIYDESLNLIKDVEVIDKTVEENSITPNNKNSSEWIIYRYPVWASGRYIFTLALNESSEQVWKDPDSSLKTSFEIWDWQGNQLYRAGFDRKISDFTVSEKSRKIFAIGAEPFDEVVVYDISEILKGLK